MTDEEKARKLYKTKRIKQLIFNTFELDGNCSDLVVEIFKSAIRMGRKENSLKIKTLKKENEELKAQIKKMECCGNCKHLMKEHNENCVFINSLNTICCNKWELAE